VCRDEKIKQIEGLTQDIKKFKKAEEEKNNERIKEIEQTDQYEEEETKVPLSYLEVIDPSKAEKINLLSMTAHRIHQDKLQVI